MNRKIVEESKQILSNNFIGNNMDAKFQAAVGLKFGFYIDNRSVDIQKARNIVIVPGHYNTMTVQKDGDNMVLAYSSVAELVAAGIPANAVLFEGTNTEADGKRGVSMGATNPKYSIRAFLDYIKLNPVNITKITLKSASTDAYNAKISFKKTNPFNDMGSTDIDAEEYFSEYQQQDGKINVTFPDAKPQLADDLLMLMTIPKGVQIDVTLHVEFPQ